MARTRQQTVWLDGERVGQVFGRDRTSVAFVYDDGVLAAYSLNTPLLSCSLPVMPGRQNARPFLGGLLPEGEHRRAMAQEARCLTDDVFALLARFGQDVAGAVVVGEHVSTRPDAGVVPYTPTSLADEVAGLAERPLALHDDSELSIAGLQDKMLLVELPAGDWARPVHGFPSTHILKLDDRAHPGLVHAEHTCLQIAGAAGLEVARSQVEQLAGIDCIIVQRFDRAPGTDGLPRRIHQEDSCQALGLDLETGGGRAKYEADGGPSLRQVAELLMGWSADPQVELRRLLELVTFTVAIGNADAHGKNVSLLHDSPGQIRLSPLYDTVPTPLWPSLRARAAMSIGGAIDLPDITVTDIVNEAHRWGLAQAVALAHTAATLERIRAACSVVDNIGALPTTDHVIARTERLLATC
jgi:serine/threonine-protein kinase HipA